MPSATTRLVDNVAPVIQLRGNQASDAKLITVVAQVETPHCTGVRVPIGNGRAWSATVNLSASQLAFLTDPGNAGKRIQMDWIGDSYSMTSISFSA
jgi:hypothetical protein